MPDRYADGRARPAGEDSHQAGLGPESSVGTPAPLHPIKPPVAAKDDLFAISASRKGLRTVRAMIAAMMLRTAAMTKTAVHLPVAETSTLPSGTRRDAVPLAVYSNP